MKNNFYKLLPLLFISLTSCSGNNTVVDLMKNAPKYQNDKQFITFGYASPTDGTYIEDGIKYSTGVDNRTKERYEEYKEAGLNTMLIQRTNPYLGEEWETSDTKMVMDLCVEAGISRCIITDERLYSLSEKTGSIWGTKIGDVTINNQDDLNAYVKKCMEDYGEHEVFYGVMLVDEPSYTYFDHVGPVYKAIKANYPSCYIQENLLPLSNSETTKARYCDGGAKMDAEVAYRNYVNAFLDATDSEKILMDSYPIRYSGSVYGEEEYENYSILDEHIMGLQILSDIASDRNVEFDAVAQTTSWKRAGTYVSGNLSMPAMQWQMNMYMGFGVKKFGYFTYWRKQNNSTSGEWFNDGTAFISQNGEKTSLYDTMKTIHEEMQSFAPVILNFEFVKSKIHAQIPLKYSVGFLGKNTEDVVYEEINSITCPTGTAYASTEMYDKTNNRYMYMLMNPLNPDWERDGTNLRTTYKVSFSSKYNAVSVYYRGKQILKPIVDGTFTIDLDPGYAVYLLPYVA